MYYKERQEKIEEAVFDAIEEIADEFDLGIPFYPTVSCLERNVEFEDSGLPSYFEQDFENLQGEWEAVFIEKPYTIILSSRGLNSVYGEEATHFVHHVNSGIKKSKRKDLDGGFVFCLSEMLGYFGSLVLGEERRNQYSEWPDPYSEPKEFKKFLIQLKKKYAQPIFLLDHVIHQQGYGLGERLFYAYQNSAITRKEITDLFKNDFRAYNSARKTFVEMREKLDWSIHIKSSSR